MKMINQDTICAIATAQGGAIGIIRVSGPKAIEITSRIFTPATGKPLTERAPYTLTFGKICSPKRKINNTLFQQTSEIPQEKSETLQKTSSITSSAEEVIDEVLISLFRAPPFLYRRRQYGNHVSRFILYPAASYTTPDL